MVYSEEERIRLRIVEALREAYPDRAVALGDGVTRWFTRHWRNESRDPVPDVDRCRFCDVQRRFGIHGKHDAIPLCSDCILDALPLVKDVRWPSRDMVRAEALRALRATGDEEAAHFVEEIASAFPDLVREEGICDACSKKTALARGARARLCAECLRRRARDVEHDVR